MHVIAHAVVHGEQGYAARVRSREHEVAADESLAAHGTNTGMAPYELLLASLGSCTSITLRMYGDRKGWKLGTIQVDLKHFKDPESERVERVLRFSEPLDEAQRARLLEIAGKTPVTRTLLRSFPIETRIE